MSERANLETVSYDVVVLGSIGAETGDEGSNVEWIVVGELKEAHEVLRRARAAKKAAVVVPARYRQARLTEEAAREIAEKALVSLTEGENKDLSELTHGEDEGACWHFSVEDYAAQARGLIPGKRRFLVDKLDGHLWSSEEAAAFWSLSAIS